MARRTKPPVFVRSLSTREAAVAIMKLVPLRLGHINTRGYYLRMAHRTAVRLLVEDVGSERFAIMESRWSRAYEEAP